MRRTIAFLYGIATYAIFLVTFVYAIGFVGDFVVPKTINSGPVVPLTEALLVNILLLGVFGIQHSAMARPAFKRVWTKIVPERLERNTYVLATCVAMGLMFWLWRAMPGVVWNVEGVAGAALWGVFGLGWVVVLISTFMINHFDLFGLRQAWLNLKNKPFGEIGFRTPAFYRFVRHPIQTGFLIAFWAIPHMTVGHLLFSVVCTAYIVVALQLEERDLVAQFGDTYRDYKRRVPMFGVGRKAPAPQRVPA